MPRAKDIAAKPAAAKPLPAQPETGSEVAVMPAPVPAQSLIPGGGGIVSLPGGQVAYPPMTGPKPTENPNEIQRTNIEGHFEKGFTHPEERSNPAYLKDLESRNLAAARPAWGVDAQAKIVNPSPNFGDRKVKVLW